MFRNGFDDGARMRRTLAVLLASTASLASAGGALAQQASAPTTAGADAATTPSASQTGGSVATIVVTAEKRSQVLVDVPASIAVVTAQDIRDKTMIALSDIAARVPNVEMSGSSLFPGITIRGVGSSSGTQTGVDPAAVVYVDGVYQGRERAENIPLNGVQQVEVLRGPQGTLYGENTIAGAINVTTVKPSDRFQADADLQFGNLGYVQGTGFMAGPLNASGADNLFGSVSVVLRNRNGWIHNEFDNRNLNYDQAEGVRARLVYDPTSRLSFELDLDYMHERDTESLLTTAYANLPALNALPPLQPNTRNESVNSPEFGGRDVGGGALHADYDLQWARLTSITSYRGYTSEYGFDSDGTPLSFDAEDDSDNANLFTQEFRLTSQGESHLKWIGGLYYSNQRLYDNFNNYFLHDFPVLLGLPPIPGFYNAGYSRGIINSNEYAAFFNAELDYGPWSLNGGLRYTIDRKSLRYSQQSTVLMGFPLNLFDLVLSPIPYATSSLNEEVPTGDISLSYKFTPDQVGYIKFSRGYKAGGFNAYLITQPFNPKVDSFSFKPEFLNNYEVGFKAAWFNQRVTLNTDVFYDNYINKQEAIEDPLALSIVIRNAAAATIYGAELETDLKPFDGFTLSGTLGLLRTKYDSFPNAGIGNACDCFTGKELPNAPQLQATVTGLYDHTLSWWNGWSGMAELEFIHTSSFFADPNNTVAYVSEPVSYLNGKFGVHSEHWGFFVWGNNLTNQYHLSGGLFESVATARAVNMPLSAGGELTYKF